MTSWVNEIIPKFHVELPRFGPSYHTFYDEHVDHMSFYNLWESFTTSVYMETYFSERDQALANMRAKIRTTWSRQNQHFQDGMNDLNNFFDSGNL